MKINRQNPVRKGLILLITFITAVLNQLNAQTTKILSLDEAVKMGISHSKQLKIDNTQLLIAGSRILQSKNANVTQISLNLGYTRVSDNITPFKVPFPTGEVTLNRQILNQSYNSLQVRQPIYNGGKTKYAAEIAALDEKAAYFNIDKSKSDADFDITTVWYNLFVAKESKKIIEANIGLLNNQKKDVQNFVNQGISLPNDLLKIELAITNLQSSLIVINNNIIQLKYNLCLLTGVETDKNIDISETLPVTSKQDGALDTYIASAVKKRPELKELDIRKKQADIDLKITKGNYLPVISLGGRVNYDQPNQRTFPNKEVLYSTWDAGAYLNWNLSELFTNRQKIKESKLNIIRANESSEQAYEGIQLEVNSDYNNYLQTTQQITNARKAVEQATENFRVEKNRFAANTATSTDFLNANTQLLQAQIDLSTAAANAELAYKQLLKSTN